MSSPAATTTYSVDTSTLMDWHDRYYPTDIFPGLVSLVDTLIAEGRLCCAEFVKEEVEAMGSAGLKAWAQSNKHIFEQTGVHLGEALQILGRFPGLSDPKAQHDEADAYVIATAVLRTGVVVTQETEASQKKSPKRTHFIPDVCRDLGIPCINLLGLMRREGWKL